LRVIAMRYAPQLIVSQNEGILLPNPPLSSDESYMEVYSKSVEIGGRRCILVGD
jgi:hypothetical protein